MIEQISPVVVQRIRQYLAWRASTRQQIELHFTDLYHGETPAGTRVVLSLPCREEG